jgi:hypothetical protein
MTKLGRAGLAGLAARAAKKATSVPKTATRSTGPLAGRRPRSTTHQGWDTYTYTYKRLHLALSDMLGVGRVLTNGVCRWRKASDAEVMAMTEAMVTFKEVLKGDRTLLTRRKS